jgi:hypothetical protein
MISLKEIISWSINSISCGDKQFIMNALFMKAAAGASLITDGYPVVTPVTMRITELEVSCEYIE